jgi:hypothetical protein
MSGIVHAGNDYVVAFLRTDLSEVYTATDYRVHLGAWDSPSQPGGFTTAWLGVDLDE